MEEDIKILEELRKELGLYANEKQVKQGIALEHLIKAYKELEENNSLLIQQNITYKRNIHDLKNKNIPVSLVEEKIEELKENGYWNYLEKRDLEITIEILQELLEKRK